MEDTKNPQSAQGQTPPRREDEDRNNPQRPGQQGQGGQPNQPGQKGDDQGKVGQDTDGDGKVVKPGQKPGQSHGEGMPGKK